MADDLLSQLAQVLLAGDGNGQSPPAPMGQPSFLGAAVPAEDSVGAGRFAQPQMAPRAAGPVPGTTLDQSGLGDKLKAMLAGSTMAGMPNGAAPAAPGVPFGLAGEMVPTSARAVPRAGPPMRPPMPQMGPSPAMAGPPASAGDEPPLAKALRAAFTGTAMVRPGQGKLSALATGGAGAMQNMQSEKERADKTKAAQSRQSFADQLAINRDRRGENADQRADQRLTTAGGKPPAWKLKYDAWLAANPNDTNGALQYAGGQRQMKPEDIRKAAQAIAQKEQQNYTTPADQKKTDARAAEIERNLREGYTGAAPQAQPSKLGGPMPEQPSLPASPITPDMKSQFEALKPGNAFNGWQLKDGATNRGDRDSWEQVTGQS